MERPDAGAFLRGGLYRIEERRRDMPAEIRLASAGDLDALIAIENDAFATDRVSRRSLARLIGSPSARILLCVRQGRVAGYAVVLFRKGSLVARLYSLAVGTGEAGRGSGRALLAAAERAALAHGAGRLRLEVREDNSRAIILYEKNGYRRIGHVPGYYADGRAALRYEKTLGDAGT